MGHGLAGGGGLAGAAHPRGFSFRTPHASAATGAFSPPACSCGGGGSVGQAVLVARQCIACSALRVPTVESDWNRLSDWLISWFHWAGCMAGCSFTSFQHFKLAVAAGLLCSWLVQPADALGRRLTIQLHTSTQLSTCSISSESVGDSQVPPCTKLCTAAATS